MTDSNAIGDSQGELDNDQAVRRFGGSLGQVKRTLQNTYDDLLLKDSTSDEDDECSNRTPRPGKVTRVENANYSSASTITTGSSPANSSHTRGLAARGASTCEKHLIRHSNDKKILFAMLLGLKPEDKSFGDPEHDNCFFNVKGKSSWTPGLKETIGEVVRRHYILFPGEKEKQCKSWKKKEGKKWLRENPITDADDVAFLLAEEKKFREQLAAAQDEKNNNKQSLYDTSQPRTEWIGLLPWLRLGHVLVHDSVYSLYQDKDRWEGRAGTDGRNSDLRPQQWFEKAEEVYNDESVTFDTLILPDLHSDFRLSYRLDKTNTPMTTAETIKKSFKRPSRNSLCH